MGKAPVPHRQPMALSDTGRHCYGTKIDLLLIGRIAGHESTACLRKFRNGLSEQVDTFARL